MILGFFLMALALLTPNANEPYSGSFFQTAQVSTWQNLFDWPAAWCSVKIILLSVGLFLVIDSVGTALALIHLKSLALSVFFLHIVPSLGFLTGAYFLIKALL